jgi:hypothetical protein
MKLLKLLPIALFASCTAASLTDQPQPEIDWHPWEYARCLPSAADTTCPGEKPSWAIYVETGLITWTYEIEGERHLVLDEWGEDWLVYDGIHCINAAGERVGLSLNVGFKSIPYREHPLTGEFWTGDDEGPTSGQFTIYGLIGPDGQVAPKSW